MSGWGGCNSFNLQYKGIKRLVLTGQKKKGAERKEPNKRRMKAARGGKEKVKELSYKEHRNSKSSIFQRNKSEVACMEKGLQPMASLVLFHTKHTHFTLLQSRQLVMFGFVDFQRQRSRRGKQKVNEALPDAALRGAVGIIHFKQWFVVFDPHPCCASLPGWPSSPRCLRGHGGALGTGRKQELWGMLSSSNLSAVLQQPFQPLRKARRWREPPWKGEEKRATLNTL